jgi:hypothetical protein
MQQRQQFCLDDERWYCWLLANNLINQIIKKFQSITLDRATIILICKKCVHCRLEEYLKKVVYRNSSSTISFSFYLHLFFRYSRLQKTCRFSVLRISHFFLIAFWPHQSSKSDFLLLLIVTLNDFYIDDLVDKFNSYMCSSFSKILYSARFFNDLIQIVWFSSRSRFSSLIFIKFISQIFRCSFLKFRLQTKKFLACQQMLAKLTFKWWFYDWFWSSFRFFDSSSSDFHQVHQSNFQMQLFEISHTNENFFLYVNQFIRKRHSSLIVNIIDRSALIESNQIRSNQIKSNQIKSNQIRSNQIKHVFIA